MAKNFKRKGRRILGIGLQDAIRFFFGGNALISILALGAICLFLVREAVLFFPQHQRDLEIYRLTGQEYAGFVIDEMDEYTELKSLADQAYYQELNEAFGVQRGLADSYGALNGEIFDEGDDLVDELADARDELEDAEGEEDIAAAKAELETKEAEWQEFLGEMLANADRSTIDTFGRLGDGDWAALLEAMEGWDPVEDEPPEVVAAAISHSAEGMADFEAARVTIRDAASSLAGCGANSPRLPARLKMRLSPTCPPQRGKKHFWRDRKTLQLRRPGPSSRNRPKPSR